MQTSSVMRWHVTACRWSFAESTHSRHDNEDRARADGVRIDCERATAAHDSRVREEKLCLREMPNSKPRLRFAARRLQFDRNQCLGGKSSGCISVLHISTHRGEQALALRNAESTFPETQVLALRSADSKAGRTSARFMNSKKSKRRKKKQKCSL